MYKCERIINSGSFGTVYKGIHIPSKTYVAIKRLPIVRHDMTQYKNTDMLRREEENWKKVSGHSNILLLKDVYVDDNIVHFVSELCEKGTLNNIMKVHVDEYATKRIASDICNGVKHCHHLQIAHCDIKPCNILIGNDDKMKISDFGNSQSCSVKSSGLFTRKCTPLYAAPELYSADYGLNVDVWSIGILVYTIVHGIVPFYSDNMKDVKDMICTRDYVWKNNLSSQCLKDFVAFCLIKCNKDRPDIDAICSHPFLQ